MFLHARVWRGMSSTTVGSERMPKLRCIVMFFFISFCCVSSPLSASGLGGGILFKSPRPVSPRHMSSPANEQPRPSFTFPNDNERLEHYAGIWHDFEYDTTRLTAAVGELCNVYRRTKPKSSHTTFDEVQILSRKDLEDCRAQSPYCEDALSFFDTGEKVEHMLVLFGDRPDNISYLPYVSKARAIDDRKSILWPLNVERHYGLMSTVNLRDTPWERKHNKLIWRGVDTGYVNNREQIVKDFFDIGDPRVDIAFGTLLLNANNKKYSRPLVSQEEIMQKKYLLSLDGNDVSSGLKWMLYSSSLVFMTPSKFETWGLESHLRPFVHYVPLLSNFSDLSQQLTWAEDNDESCRNVSLSATKFMSHFEGYTADRGRATDIHLKRSLVKIYNRAMKAVLANFSLSNCA